jgi:hypothetical protein
MDHHVHGEITLALRRRNIDVLIALEDGHHDVDDSILLNRATELRRILFSQDRDLLACASASQIASHHFAGLIYAHQLSLTIGQIITDLELICLACEPTELANQVIYLPL